MAIKTFKYFDAGISFRDKASDANTSEGDTWRNGNDLKTFIQGAVRKLVTDTQTQTLTNKSIDASTNTITNLTTTNFATGIIDTDLGLTSGNDDTIPSAKAVKAYVDANSGGGSGATGTSFNAIQAGHGFTAITPIYHDGLIWQKAKADNANTLALYLVTEVTTNSFKAIKFGVATISSHGLTVGQFYYTSTTVAGAVTDVEPSTGFSNPVLYVENVNSIHIMCHRPVAVPTFGVSSSGGSSSSSLNEYILCGGLATSATIVSGYNVVKMGTVESHNNIIYDTATGIGTIPNAGVYSMSFGITVGASSSWVLGDWVQAAIFFNGESSPPSHHIIRTYATAGIPSVLATLTINGVVLPANSTFILKVAIVGSGAHGITTDYGNQISFVRTA